MKSASARKKQVRKERALQRQVRGRAKAGAERRLFDTGTDRAQLERLPQLIRQKRQQLAEFAAGHVLE